MRQHRHVARGDEIEHRLGKARWRHRVRRLEQKIAAARERRRGARAQAPEQFGRQMRVGAERELERDAFVEQSPLQRLDAGLDSGGVVFVEPRIDMRRARRGADAVGDRDARHFERRRLVGRAVVDAGQQVAVEVDHGSMIAADAGPLAGS